MYGVKENDDSKFLNQHNDYPLYFRPNHKYRFKEGNILDREKMQLCLSLTPMLGSGKEASRPYPKVHLRVEDLGKRLLVSSSANVSSNHIQDLHPSDLKGHCPMPTPRLDTYCITLWVARTPNLRIHRRNNSRAGFLPRSTCRNRLVRESPEEQAFGGESVRGLGAGPFHLTGYACEKPQSMINPVRGAGPSYRLAESECYRLNQH